MANANWEGSLNVSKDSLFDAILDFEHYPDFVDGVTRVKVDRSGGKCLVTYHVSMVKDVIYTLEHTEDREAGRLEWELVESSFFTKNSGHWQITAEGDSSCYVEYEIEADFSLPMPGFMVKKLIQANLPKMIKNFEEQAKA